jgi:choline dehydrogenase-like flavoprotein
VCIIGGGPAGLSIARHLDGSAHRVVVLERGHGPGKPLGVRSGDVAIGRSDLAPPPTPPPRFGGAANEWIVRLPWHRRGVRMLPLSPIDFEARPWLPHSGWPFDLAHLDRHYAAAHELLDLGAFDYDLAGWENPRSPRLALEASGLTTAIERFARADIFTSSIWAQLRRSQNVEVHLGATVGALSGKDGRVELAEIDHGRRARLTVAADVFVLAASGFENPRLLLASNDGRGIGNEHDVVGRYHMDHVRMISGTLTPSDPRSFEGMSLYDIQARNGAWRMGKLVPTASSMHAANLLNSGAMLLPKLSAATRTTVERAGAALRAVRSGHRPDDLPAARDVARTASRLARTAVEMAVRQRRFPPRTDAGWSQLRGNGRRWATFDVEHQLEQVPDPSNRIRLDDRSDEFGRRRTVLDWTWSEHELRNIRATQELFEHAFAHSGIGRFEPQGWDDVPVLTTPGGAYHPMGGTRMHADPQRGVVDPTAQVHGWPNLFVAGSSVFPTGGYANPTLTVIALALRLAAEIERRFSPARVASG